MADPVQNTTTTQAPPIMPVVDEGGGFGPPPTPTNPTSASNVVSPRRTGPKGKIIATILGLVLLVGGVGAGVLLVQQQQELREKADICYNAAVPGQCPAGFVPGGPLNGAGQYTWCCPAPQATEPPATTAPTAPPGPAGPVCGNGVCESGESYSNCQADCSASSGGCTVTGGGLLGACITVGQDCATNNQLPTAVTYQGGGFDTAAEAGDCVVNDNTPGVSVISSGTAGPGTYCPHTTNTVEKYGCGSCMQMDIGGHGATSWSGPCATTTGPTPTPPTGTTQCLNIKAYDTDWNQIVDLNSLAQGDTVRFAAAGSAASGNFDRARFTINGVLRPEVTGSVPSTTPPEFYDEYVIPAGVTSFTVGAEIHHQQTDSWY